MRTKSNKKKPIKYELSSIKDKAIDMVKKRGNLFEYHFISAIDQLMELRWVSIQS